MTRIIEITSSEYGWRGIVRERGHNFVLGAKPSPADVLTDAYVYFGPPGRPLTKPERLVESGLQLLGVNPPAGVRGDLLRLLGSDMRWQKPEKWRRRVRYILTKCGVGGCTPKEFIGIHAGSSKGDH